MNATLDTTGTAEWLSEFFGQELAGGSVRLALHAREADEWDELLGMSPDRPPFAGHDNWLGALADSIAMAAASWDVYCCPYPHESRHRRAGGATLRRHVHADVDGPVDLDVVQELGGFAVASGSVTGGEPHGHVYLRLSESVPFEQHQRLCRALGAALGPDHDDSKVADNDVLRPVGTLNHKPGRGPVTWLVRPDGARTWAPAELEERLGASDPNPAALVPQRPAGALPGGPRKFTQQQAEDYVAPWLEQLREAVSGPGAGRNNALNTAAIVVGHFVGPWLTEEEALDLLRAARPDLPPNEFKATARSGFRAAQRDWIAEMVDESSSPVASGKAKDRKVKKQKAAGQVEAKLGFSDAAIAATIAEGALKDRFCWSGGLGWLRWTGVIWEDASEVSVVEVVRQFVLAEVARAATDLRRDVPGADLRLAGWQSMLSRSRLTSATTLARGIVQVDPRIFDADLDVLNTPSGVVDLRTGQLRPTEAGAPFRKVTAAGYEPGATHPDWVTALEALPDDDRTWLQAFLGQALTGHANDEDWLLVATGGGRNGKSSIMNYGLRTALGEYAVTLTDRAIMAAASGDHNMHTTEVTGLMGARLALLEETAEARQLDTQRLKKITGSGTITARKMRHDDVTFPITHTLVINTNHVPIVTETDSGTWERLQRMSFPYRYRKEGEELEGPEDRAGDLRLRSRIKTDPQVQAAVLAWAVQGAVAWYAAGRKLPRPTATMRAAKDAWQGGTDPVLGFLASDHVRLDPMAECGQTDLREAFAEYLREEGMRPWSPRLYGERFKAHPGLAVKGITPGQTRGGQRVWRGIERMKFSLTVVASDRAFR